MDKLHQRRMLDKQHAGLRKSTAGRHGWGSIALALALCLLALLILSLTLDHTALRRQGLSLDWGVASLSVSTGGGQPVDGPSRPRPGIVTANVLDPCRPSVISMLPAAAVSQLCLVPRQAAAHQRQAAEADGATATVPPGGVAEGVRVITADEEEADIMDGGALPALAAFGQTQGRQIQSWTALLAAKEATARQTHRLDNTDGDGRSTVFTPSQRVGPIQCCQPSPIASYMNFMQLQRVPVSYARVFKAANNAVQAHLVRQAVQQGVSVRSVSFTGSPHRSKSACVFTVVRNPIDRLVSAFGELEMRMYRARAYGLELGAVMRTAAAHGSPERARKFVLALGELTVPCCAVELVNDYADIAVSHIIPQYRFLLPTTPELAAAGGGSINTGNTSLVTEQSLAQFNVVGKVENIEKDWQKIAGSCGIGLGRWDSTLTGHHDAPEDAAVKRSASAAMRELLATDVAALRRVCVAYRFDFELLGYAVPAECV